MLAPFLLWIFLLCQGVAVWFTSIYCRGWYRSILTACVIEKWTDNSMVVPGTLMQDSTRSSSFELRVSIDQAKPAFISP
jgi:hypothetical protein